MKALIKFITVIFSLGVLGVLFVFGLFVYMSFDLPKISSLADYNPPVASRILSSDGEVLLEVAKEKREVVEFKKIPTRLVNSFLAAEDDNFYQHKGVDYMGLARAMWKNVLAGKVVQGGSTITQQVAKSLLLTRKKTITRKIKDFLLAQKIEEQFSKEDILFLYLNQVYLGGGYYGIKSAVRGYFDKDLEDVTIAESALIAGLLVAPGRYSPYVNPKKAKMRQTYVLGRLFKTGKITQEEYEAAKAEKIKIRLRTGSTFKAGHFTDWVRQRVVEKVGNEEFLTGGFEVVTTLNWELQKKAEEYALAGVKEIERRQGYQGPLENLDQNQWVDFFIKQRKEIYSDNSTFIIFNPDGTNQKEHEFDPEEIESLLTKKKEVLRDSKLARSKVKPGVIEEKFLTYLKIGNTYKAVVESVLDNQAMIYASIAGVSVAIPYDGFKWAHERNISEDVKYWSWVKQPSTIVKKGDVVYVKLISEPETLEKKFIRKYQDILKRRKIEQKFYEQQKYYIAELDQPTKLEAALLSLDPATGNVVSMVGGVDFSKSQFNRVIQSNRQPGSSFKPFIYAAALENGFYPNSILSDSPQTLGGADQSLDWKPKNYDGKFKGEMTFRRALEVSRNIPTIKLVQDVGVDKITDFSKRLGFTTTFPADLSISLGSFGVSLAELVQIYSVFPSMGKKVYLKSIVSIKDNTGKIYTIDEMPQDDLSIEKTQTTEEAKPEVVAEEPAKEVKEGEESKENMEEVKKNIFLESIGGDQVYDQRLAFIMTNLLKGVVENGTGRRAREVGSFIGGKTGTTNNYVDAWFLGFSKSLVTGVWVGFDDNSTIGWPESGSKAALPIWVDFMKDAKKTYGESDFVAPPGIVNVLVNKETGDVAKAGDSNTLLESFVEGYEPGRQEETAPVEPNPGEGTILLDDDEYYSTE